MEARNQITIGVCGLLSLGVAMMSMGGDDDDSELEEDAPVDSGDNQPEPATNDDSSADPYGGYYYGYY